MVDADALLGAMPSYQAERGSLTLMTTMLMAIAALVAGAFFTVWGIQRRADVAVLKALGASTAVLVRDWLGQAVTVLVVGVATGVGLAAVGGVLIPETVPYVVTAGTTVVPALALVALGLLGAAGYLVLPQGLRVLQHPAVLTVSGVLLSFEFLADKVPGIDSLWDLMNGLIRVPAGALLAAAVFFGADNGLMTMLAGLLGGTLAATSQAAKTTTRAAINASPEPFSNIGASLVEDGASVGAVWLAATHPLVFGVLLVVVVLAMWVVTWLLIRFLRGAFARLSQLLRSSSNNPAPGRGN